MQINSTLLTLADRLASLSNRNKTVREEIAAARRRFETRDDPAVQLYGLSQAGKSTLLSCLTLGEQLIPIGTGTATTAVIIELIPSTAELGRAEVEWLSPDEIQELVEQPLRYFLEDYKGFSSKRGADAASSRTSDGEEEPSGPARDGGSGLDSPKYQKHLWKMLSAARRARGAERTKVVGADNDLAVTEIILRHYESYIRGYQQGFHEIGSLSELSDWTRQPVTWGSWDEKPLADYQFHEVKSFFTKAVRLYAPVQRTVDGLRVLDSPGFGISNIHDRICRSAQLAAEAVFLIVGQQLGQDQMREMQQLSAGLKDNLFVIWNSKDTTRRNAQDLLASTLVKLKNEAGIVVPNERTAVVNLHLTLRAMQCTVVGTKGALQEQTERSLRERFSRIYKFDAARDKIERGIRRELRKATGTFTDDFDGDEIDDDRPDEAVGRSGWNDVIELLGKAKELPQKRKELRFVVALAGAAIRFLEGFPTAKEIAEAHQAIDALSEVAQELVTSIIKKNRRALEREWESESDRMFDEFLDYLTDRQEVRNLKASLADKIRSASHYSTVTPKLVAGIDDYVRARSKVWTQKVASFETIATHDCILSPYRGAARDITEWVHTAWEQRNPSGSLEIPAPPVPAVTLDGFQQEFVAWNKVIVAKEFTPNWVENSVTWVRESATEAWQEVKKAARSLWSAAKNWWYGTDEKVTPPKETPSFNRSSAIAKMEKAVDGHLSKRTLRGLYELGKDQTAFVAAMSEKEGSSYDSWADIIIDYMHRVNVSFWWEQCSRFCAIWEDASNEIKKSMDRSLYAWANSIAPMLNERVRNLSSTSPQPISPEVLAEVAQLFEISDFAGTEDESIVNALSQLSRTIDSRRIDATS